MEFLFTNARVNGKDEDVLRIKNPETSYQKNEYVTLCLNTGVEKINHTCIIKDMIKTEGEYVWYTVKEHTVFTDNTPELERQIEKLNATIDYISMMADIELPDEEEDQNNEPEV